MKNIITLLLVVFTMTIATAQTNTTIEVENWGTYNYNNVIEQPNWYPRETYGTANTQQVSVKFVDNSFVFSDKGVVIAQYQITNNIINNTTNNIGWNVINPVNNLNSLYNWGNVNQIWIVQDTYGIPSIRLYNSYNPMQTISFGIDTNLVNNLLNY